MLFVLVAIQIIIAAKAHQKDSVSSDSDETCSETLRLCDRAEIHDLFETNFALRDDATLENGDAVDRQRRIDEYETFLNTFYADDVTIISSQNPSNPIIGKENAINLVITSMTASRDIRHIAGGLKYDFVSSNEATVRETHRTTGYLPDFTSFPPGPPQWFRGDDTHFYTFKKINGVWKLKQLISNPRIDADLIPQTVSENANAANAQANIEDEGSDAPAHDIKDETPAETFSILTVIIIIGIVLLVVLTCAIYQYGEKRKYLKELNAIADVQNNEQNNDSDTKQSVIDITHTQTKD